MDPPSHGAYEDAEEIPSMISSCSPPIVFMANQHSSDIYEDAKVNLPGTSTMSFLSPVDLHDRAKEEFNQLDAVVARMYEKMRKSLKNDEPERIQIMREAIEKKIEEVYSCDSNVTLIRRASMQKEGRKPKAAPIQPFKTVHVDTLTKLSVSLIVCGGEFMVI
ncbi:unnamed protein product [Cylicostephanus goldi]|uniref:Uncharacterized protein n=1 Tax=Cylicostephanus goldi TaxID=71465 RepID=A0A3P6RC46_CYLGO|nr:unnamed protein product [Cylicostephanus goldi]